MESGKQDPAYLLNYLSKNKLNIDYCRYIVDMNLISKLYGYYRFAGYYPYPKRNAYHVPRVPAALVTGQRGHSIRFVVRSVTRHFPIAWYVKTGVVGITCVRIFFGAISVTLLQRCGPYKV